MEHVRSGLVGVGFRIGLGALLAWGGLMPRAAAQDLEVRAVDAETGAPVALLRVDYGLGQVVLPFETASHPTWKAVTLSLDAVAPADEDGNVEPSRVVVPGPSLDRMASVAAMPLELSLVATAVGYELGAKTLDAKTLAARGVVEFQLTSTGYVEFDVVAKADGRPIEGAVVSAYSLKSSRPARVLPSSSTNAAGKAWVMHRPFLTSVPMMVTGPSGFAPLRLGEVAIPQSGRIQRRVELAAGGVITVRLLDTLGQPVLENVSVLHIDSFRVSHKLRATGGKLVVSGLAAGSHSMHVVEPLLEPSELNMSIKVWPKALAVLVEEGGDVALDLLVPTRRTVTGVLTAAGGLPLERAGIACRMRSGVGGVLLTNSDHLGRFEFFDVPVGEVEVVAMHDSLAVPLFAELKVSAEAEAKNRFALSTSELEFSGSVLSSSGFPVSGAQFSVQLSESDATVEGASAETLGPAEARQNKVRGSWFDSLLVSQAPTIRSDAQGRFVIRGIPDRMPFELRIEARWHEPRVLSLDYRNAEPPLKHRRVMLVESGRVGLLVADHYDNCVAVARWASRDLGEDSPASVSAPIQFHRVTLKGLRPGSWEVALEREGEVLESRKVEVLAKKTTKVEFADR